LFDTVAMEKVSKKEAVIDGGQDHGGRFGMLKHVQNVTDNEFSFEEDGKARDG
jgi:hypothetical protein